MGPRLHQIDELNKLGLTPEDEAKLLGLPLKTVREYQYRIRQIDGEVRARGGAGHARNVEREAISAEVIRCLVEVENCRAAGRDPHATPAQKLGAIQGEVDWMVAAQMAQERYGLSKKEGRMPEQKQHESESIEQILSARRSEILLKSGSVVAVSAAEAGAALNYFRGRAEEFNETREAIVRTHPERAKDLPGPILVDEIQVRQRVLQHERGEEKSLQIAR